MERGQTQRKRGMRPIGSGRVGRSIAVGMGLLFGFGPLMAQLPEAGPWLLDDAPPPTMKLYWARTGGRWSYSPWTGKRPFGKKGRPGSLNSKGARTKRRRPASGAVSPPGSRPGPTWATSCMWICISNRAWRSSAPWMKDDTRSGSAPNSLMESGRRLGGCLSSKTGWAMRPLGCSMYRRPRRRLLVGVRPGPIWKAIVAEPGGRFRWCESRAGAIMPGYPRVAEHTG